MPQHTKAERHSHQDNRGAGKGDEAEERKRRAPLKHDGFSKIRAQRISKGLVPRSFSGKAGAAIG